MTSLDPTMKLSDKALDYTQLDGPALMSECRDDASKWATAFCQHAIKLGHTDIDEGWMIGWFANAIENSSDVRRRASPAPSSDLVERLTEAEAIIAERNDGLALIDWISDKIGLPHDQELSRENFATWFDTLAAQAARIAELEGWQPIETAPKDAHILLDLGETPPGIVDARVGQFISEYHAAQLDEALSASGGWIIWNTASDWFVIPFSDAHGWLPLPSARRALASIRGGA